MALVTIGGREFFETKGVRIDLARYFDECLTNGTEPSDAFEIHSFSVREPLFSLKVGSRSVGFFKGALHALNKVAHRLSFRRVRGQ